MCVKSGGTNHNRAARKVYKRFINVRFLRFKRLYSYLNVFTWVIAYLCCVPLTSWAVNSSWVRATRVIHFVIKDGGGKMFVPFSCRKLVITISRSRVHQLNETQHCTPDAFLRSLTIHCTLEWIGHCLSAHDRQMTITVITLMREAYKSMFEFISNAKCRLHETLVQSNH